MSEKKTYVKQKKRVEYGALTTDLKQPLILQQDGRPAAVILPFERYLRLRELETSEEERRRGAWSQLNVLVERVHRRPSPYTSAQIEAEISTARAEVKEMRHARHSRR
jgi:PHD/YefM family antitoxin component YafN of YafNO toxin-antitoxin module